MLLPEAVAATTPERRRSYLRSYLPGAALLGAALLAPTWLGGRLAAHLFPAAMPGAVRVFQLLATAQIALLVADLPPAQRSRLSAIASRVVAADARRRGIDIYATDPGSGI